MVKQNKNLHTNKKNQLLIGLFFLIVLLAAGGFMYTKHRATTKADSTNGSTINLSPATPEEKAESDRQKNRTIENEQQKDTTPPGTKKSVTPVIVDANQYDQTIEVRSYIPGIIEDGGTCTITMTKGSLTVTKQVPGAKDATTTICQRVAVSRSEFSEAGTWSATVNYASSTASGSSKSTTFEVR